MSCGGRVAAMAVDAAKPLLAMDVRSGEQLSPAPHSLLSGSAAWHVRHVFGRVPVCAPRVPRDAQSSIARDEQATCSVV